MLCYHTLNRGLVGYEPWALRKGGDVEGTNNHYQLKSLSLEKKKEKRAEESQHT